MIGIGNRIEELDYYVSPIRQSIIRRCMREWNNKSMARHNRPRKSFSPLPPALYIEERKLS
jgi:hypothetical protein